MKAIHNSISNRKITVMKKKLVFPLLILALSTMACGITLQTPEIKTGPETTTRVDESYPNSNDMPRVILKMGAGSLEIENGGNKMVEGEIRTNIANWKPEVSRSNEEITIAQGENNNSITFPSGNMINNWNLKLGTQKPLALDIQAGAYKSNITFGDVQLSELNIDDGASQSKITFDVPNKQKMDSLTYHTGASQVELINLGNANFKKMVFDSGAGSYTLDFNGELKQDAKVSIKSGLSNFKIIVPSNTDTNITLTGGVNNVSLKGTWTVNSNKYMTQNSKRPKLEIDINMGVGNLELISENSSSL
jgi:hypothetical protein